MLADEGFKTAPPSPAARGTYGALALVPAAALWLAGCTAEPTRYRHELVSGEVWAVQPESGRLVVYGAGLRPDDDQEEVACVLTGEPELYINDKYSSWDALRVGDAIEVIGYPDRRPNAEGLVVCLALVTRSDAPVPPPDLEPSALPSKE
ncbi:MAG: hypothetical protein AB1716_01790 [Planctomycetota bacterium]